MISRLVYIGWRLFLSCALVLSLAFSFNANNAFAQFSDNDYIINDVEVFAEGETPNQARQNAIADAQIKAFIILLERLSLNTSLAYSFDIKTIADMVRAQQITNEKIAGNSYSAILNITFSKGFVEHYLSDETLIQNAKRAETILVIPIKVIENQKLIWEEGNDWVDAMKEAVSENSSAKAIIKFPKGDVDDIAYTNPIIYGYDISSNKNINYRDFESLLNKYKADTIILAYFEFDDLENKVNIPLKIIKKFRYKQVRLSFINVNQLSFQSLINKVSSKTVEYISSEKIKDEKRENSTSTVKLDIFIDSLGDWLTVKNKLEHLHLVETLEVNSISKEMVRASVVYNNRNGNIIEFFARNNLYLHKRDEDYYALDVGKKSKGFFR